MSKTSVTDYDPLAKKYAAEIDGRAWNALYERPAMLAALPNVAGLEVLDAGCGPGWYAEQLASRGARVIAVDASARMVEIARRRLGSRAVVHHADIARLGAAVASSQLDLIVSALAAHYVENLHDLFAEWARVLRVGGHVVFSTHHPFWNIERIRAGEYQNAAIVEDDWPSLGKIQYWDRPLRDIVKPLFENGFVIELLEEPKPSEELRVADPRTYEWCGKRPGALIVRAQRR